MSKSSGYHMQLDRLTDSPRPQWGRFPACPRLCLLLLAATTHLYSQESSLGVSCALWKGIEVRFLTKLEPQGITLPGGVVPAADRAHHFIRDSANRRYFGYDLLLEPRADGQAAQLKLQPLTLRGFKIDSGWTLISPPHYPVIPGVRIGETVVIDLLVNPSTGQKVVDYLTLNRTVFEGGAAGEPPHDLALADVELSLDRPRVTVDGKLVEATLNDGGGISGPAVGFYVAGHGRFAISLLPRPAIGFQKAGAVSGHKLSFQDGGAKYQIESQSRIAPGSGVYNLYLYRDPNWRSRGADASAGHFLEAGSPEWVIRKDRLE